jgi:hypothetical protein
VSILIAAVRAEAGSVATVAAKTARELLAKSRQLRAASEKSATSASSRREAVRWLLNCVDPACE